MFGRISPIVEFFGDCGRAHSVKPLRNIIDCHYQYIANKSNSASDCPTPENIAPCCWPHLARQLFTCSSCDTLWLQDRFIELNHRPSLRSCANKLPEEVLTIGQPVLFDQTHAIRFLVLQYQNAISAFHGFAIPWHSMALRGVIGVCVGVGTGIGSDTLHWHWQSGTGRKRCVVSSPIPSDTTENDSLINSLSLWQVVVMGSRQCLRVSRQSQHHLSGERERCVHRTKFREIINLQSAPPSFQSQVRSK